jgi:hypothetical protein
MTIIRQLTIITIAVLRQDKDGLTGIVYGYVDVEAECGAYNCFTG